MSIHSNPASIEDRISHVYELALDGMTVRQIARSIGISKSQAGRDLRTAIEEIPPQERHEMRLMAADRFNRWLVEIHEAIKMGGDAAKLIAIGVQIEMARARLFGLSQEAESDVGNRFNSNPPTVEVAHLIRSIERQVAAEVAQEEDKIRNGEEE